MLTPEKGKERQVTNGKPNPRPRPTQRDGGQRVHPDVMVHGRAGPELPTEKDPWDVKSTFAF
jgi:hypothetical protein